MRHTQRCPKCSYRKLWRMSPFMIPEPDSNNVVEPLPVVARSSSGTTETHAFGKRHVAGAFEVWICATCGYTEWHAGGVNEVLAKLAQTPGSGVAYVDGDVGSIADATGTRGLR